jgi:NitT/TauT family transport system substrate-binding protein
VDSTALFPINVLCDEFPVALKAGLAEALPRRHPAQRRSLQMLRPAIRSAVLVSCLAASVAWVTAASAEVKKDFKIAWSIYVGYMPWDYMQESGILAKAAAKHGIKITTEQVGDYIESLTQFTSGKYDGVAGTTMDALSIPAAGGVDTTLLMATDYSNGNDGIVLKGKNKLEDIKGQKVNIVELSVSHYMLVKALDGIGLTESDVTIVNTSDADMISAFKTADVTAAVTWNPAFSAIKNEPGATSVFDSSQMPGELVDVMMVNTETLKDNPEFGKALVEAWFETLAVMMSDTDAGKAARTSMAKASGTDLASFESQMKTTKFMLTPAEANAFVSDPKLKASFDAIRKFLFAKGLYPKGAKSEDDIGIEFADGSVIGSKDNVKLRFSTQYLSQPK